MPPLVALHGTEDPALKYPKTVACVEALTARGATVSLKTYPGVAHVISPPMRAELHQQLMTSLAQQAAEDPFRAP
jgi:predicted esterase